jgi:hypothetical protein
MWVVYCFLSYLLLALMIPVAWSLVPVWLRTHGSRNLYCPAARHSARVNLDPWHAVKMHALGDQELCVKGCSEWPQRRGCEQACLMQMTARRSRPPLRAHEA